MANQDNEQGTVVTGEEKIRALRLITMWRALRMEIETGMKLTRIPVLPLIKRELGPGAPRTKVQCYWAFSRLLADKGLLVLE